MPGVRVLIVDPRRLSREGLRLLLAGETYHVVGTTGSLAAALSEIEADGRADLLIVVLHDADEAFDSPALQRIRAIAPACKIVLIASAFTPSLPRPVCISQVDALLRDEMSGEALTRSLHLVMQGQAIFPASSARPPVGPDPASRDEADLAAAGASGRLSDLETRILHHLVSGYSNKAIARELAITDAAVKVQMKTILRKLNVHSRTQAAIWAHGNGFSEQSDAAPSPVDARPAGGTGGSQAKLPRS